MLVKRKIFAVLFLICVSTLWAGDAASFVDLGFSPDGRTYMFGQFGVQSGNLRPWAELYIVDVAANNFVSNGRFSHTLDRPIVAGQDGSGVFYRLLASNVSHTNRHGVDHQNQGLPLSDLINEGNLGLLRAAKRFDEKKNFKFISYAVWWIRQAILQALAEQSRIIKLPLNRVGAIHKIGKTQSRLEQRLRRVPNAGEIANELQIGEDEVQDAIKIGNSHMSLDAPLQGGEDSKLLDLIKDEDQLPPDDGLMGISLHEEINRTLDTLSEREKEVVRLYFGIGEETSHTLEEIGQRFNLTRERARQIKEKALRRLKHSSRSKRLLGYRS